MSLPVTPPTPSGVTPASPCSPRRKPSPSSETLSSSPPANRTSTTTSTSPSTSPSPRRSTTSAPRPRKRLEGPTSSRPISPSRCRSELLPPGGRPGVPHLLPVRPRSGVDGRVVLLPRSHRARPAVLSLSVSSTAVPVTRERPASATRAAAPATSSALVISVSVIPAASSMPTRTWPPRSRAWRASGLSSRGIAEQAHGPGQGATVHHRQVHVEGGGRRWQPEVDAGCVRAIDQVTAPEVQLDHRRRSVDVVESGDEAGQVADAGAVGYGTA